MEPLLPRLIRHAAPKARRRVGLQSCRVSPIAAHVSLIRSFGTSLAAHATSKDNRKDPYVAPNVQDSSYSQPASNLSQNVSPAESNHFERIEEESRSKQRESPWMREGSNVPPVRRDRSVSAMTKGKLLTTPSRMLKFIIPLSTRDTNDDRKDMEPLALLVHPQQPLSYLERLIQSELPVLDSGRPPTVTFRAEDTASGDEALGEETPSTKKRDDEGEDDFSQEDKTRIDGKVERTGKLNKQQDDKPPAEGQKDTATDSPPEDPNRPNFVRWSPSTEVGDFIRDAARGKEFAVDIEGAGPIYVGVPSFADRTYYLRMRLRKTGQKISQLADLKKHCDHLAHQGARRVAQMGFMGLLSWWGIVYYLTFKTELGWDVMEPVTYLVGLSGLIGGYMWFLYHNREVSYRSAMNFTVSRRQSQLYEQKNFNLHAWEMLIEEGNKLRREVKMIADEYDVEWNETKDEGDEKVTEALKEERKKNNNGEKKKKKKDDDDEQDDDDD